MKTYRHFHILGAGVALSVAGVLVGALLAPAATTPEPAAESKEPLHEQVALFLDQHCATCHNDTDAEGDLDIVALKFDPKDPENLKIWQEIYDQTEAGEMPPKEKRPPREPQKKEFLQTVEAALKSAQKG